MIVKCSLMFLYVERLLKSIKTFENAVYRHEDAGNGKIGPRALKARAKKWWLSDENGGRAPVISPDPTCSTVVDY